jgi:predicted amidohydrolase
MKANVRMRRSLCLLVLALVGGVSYGGQAKTFKVAAVQAVSRFGDVEWNRAHLAKLVREAAGNGAKVIVLPETSITGYMTHDIKTTWQVGDRRVTQGLAGVDPRAAAETVPGESTRFFAELAGELKVYLTVPLLEFDPRNQNYYNTVVLISPDTTYCGYYRKLNPWPFAERGWAVPGDLGHEIIDTPYGRMGLLICFDINFEPPRLKELGVDHLLYPIAWVEEAGSDWFEKRLPEIAAKNDISIIGANWTVPAGYEPDWHGWGQSRIIDRRGTVLARAKNNRAEEIVYADLPVPDDGRAAVSGQSAIGNEANAERPPVK